MMRNLAFLILFGVFISCVWAQDPEITENILPEIKRVGLTGRLKCVVINQMDNPTYWIHKDRSMSITKDDKVEIDEAHNKIENGRYKYEVEHIREGDRNTYILIVNRLERRDSGTYTCQLWVRGNTKHPSKDAQMVVLVPPSISNARTSHTVTVREGEALNLTCDAIGYPTPNITWVRVSGSTLPDGKLRHIGKDFPIAKVGVGDRGIYRCLADNSVRPPAVFDATLLVIFSPRAHAIQSSYGQAANRMFDITMECRIAGWPEPDLQWYKEMSPTNWKPINNDDKHTINILLNHANVLESQERWFQIVIRSVTANDFGNYICAGRNDYGNGHGVVKLFATSECQGPNCPNEQEPGKNSANKMAVSFYTVLLTFIALLYKNV